MPVMPPCQTLQNATSYTTPPANTQDQNWQETLADVQNNAPTQASTPAVQAPASDSSVPADSATATPTPTPHVQAPASDPTTADKSKPESSSTSSADATPTPKIVEKDKGEANTATDTTKTDHKKNQPTLVVPLVVVPPSILNTPKIAAPEHATPAVAPARETAKVTIAGTNNSDTQAELSGQASPAGPAATGDMDKKPMPPSVSPASEMAKAQPPQSGTQTPSSTIDTSSPPPAASPRQATISTASSTAPISAVASRPASTTSQLLVNRVVQNPTLITSSFSKELEPAKPSTTLATPLGTGFNLNTTTSIAPTSAATSPAALSALPGSDAATNNGAALAATVTALHQSGQTNTIMRLDPPGLGHLSVQVGLNTQGQINVLFVPSSADAAHILQATLSHFHQAATQSGLTLGQAQVGGQFAQSGGQNGQPGQNPRAPERQNANSVTAPEPQTATISGLSAYA